MACTRRRCRKQSRRTRKHSSRRSKKYVHRLREGGAGLIIL